MPSANYSHAVHRANVWIADVARSLETDDRRVAHRVLRAWLHALRDRLTVEATAKFGQQLPELLRGEYYDGWEPTHAPVKYDAAAYIRRFSAEALVAPEDVPAIAAIVTDVMTGRMSPGQVEAALAELPGDLRATVRDGVPPSGLSGNGRVTSRPVTLDERVVALGEALRTLARGLEDEHATGAGVSQAKVARAARLAEEILVAAGR